MKTTIDIPDVILQETMLHTQSATKRDAVLAAMEDFNRRARLRALADQFGQSDTFMSLNDLSTLRDADFPTEQSGPAIKS